MVSKKKIILLAILAIIVIFGVYLFLNYQQGQETFKGEHNILILCSELIWHLLLMLIMENWVM